jgi:hypothetical protein
MADVATSRWNDVLARLMVLDRDPAEVTMAELIPLVWTMMMEDLSHWLSIGFIDPRKAADAFQRIVADLRRRLYGPGPSEVASSLPESVQRRLVELGIDLEDAPDWWRKVGG